MIGLRRIVLHARAAWHRWRSQRHLDAGTRHARRADEFDLKAAEIKSTDIVARLAATLTGKRSNDDV